jgi:hypothetical protein
MNNPHPEVLRLENWELAIALECPNIPKSSRLRLQQKLNQVIEYWKNQKAKPFNTHTHPVAEGYPFSGITSEWYVGFDAANERLQSIPLEKRGVYTQKSPLCTSTPMGMFQNTPNDYYIQYHREDGLFRVDFKA